MLFLCPLLCVLSIPILLKPMASVTLRVCTLSHFSRVQLFETPWTVAHQAPLSMEFSRQELLEWLPGPPPGDLPDPGIEWRLLCLLR